MFFFILFGLVAVWFLISVAVAALGTEEVRFGGIASTVVAFIVGLAVFLGFSATTVDARAVGIQTSFGKYVDTLDNGFHLTAPWSSVEEFSTNVQDLDLTVPVSFDGGSSGEVKMTALWAIESKDAQELWQDWKDFDRVRDRLVGPATRTATAAAFSAYTPDTAKDGANRVTIEDAIGTTLAELKASGVEVRSIQITDVKLGDRAQAAVDRIVEATANTQRAQEEQERAKIDAETARIQAETQTPDTIQRRCLEILNNWDASKNGNAPALLNCNFGANSQTPVIVGQ